MNQHNDNGKPKQDPVDAVTVDQWQREFTEAAVTELYTLIKQQEGHYGVEFGDKLRLSILAALVSTFLYEILSSLPKGAGSIERQTDGAYAAFADAKEALEMAVASGVEGAVKTWSGSDLLYYCEIMPEPEALNIEPC